jgi:hypothetical protein
MFVPVLLDISDGLDSDALTFVTFRRTLKKMLRDNDETFVDMNTKQMMKKLRRRMSYEEPSVKTRPSKLDAASCGVLLAKTVYMMYALLCSMDHEFDTGGKIKRIAGIVQDSPRGTAMEKIIYALDIVDGISCSHPCFDVLIDGIDSIDAYFEKAKRLTISI